MNQMSALDVAWLAGILEGEGCFTKSGAKKNYGTPRVVLMMTDKDVVEKAARLMDAKITSRKPSKGKMQWWLDIGSQKAIDVMKIVLPHMGERRSLRIRELIGFWDARPGCSGAMSNRMKAFWASKTADERKLIATKMRSGESWGAGGRW